MRLGDAGRLRNGNLQLLFRGRQMQHEEGHIEHSLVAALQILQEIFRRAAVGGEVGGENIQIVAAAGGLLLLLDLHGVQIGDLALDHLDGLVLVDAADVHGDEKVSLHIHEIREDTVLNLRGQYLQKGHRAVHFADAETPRLAKLEGRRRDKVLDGQAACREPVPFKGELSALRMEKAMQQRQPLFAVQHPCARAHDLEAVQGVCLDPGKPCPRRRKIFRLDGQRDTFALYKAVVAALILYLQDAGRLHAHIIQRVALGVHAEQVSVLVLMAAAQGHLHADGGIIAVIEIAEAFKDIPLVVRPRQTVVDVLIGYGLGEKPVVQPAQAVRVQVPKRDAVLHGMGLAVALRLPDDGFNLFSLRPRELTLCGGLRVFRFCRSFQQSPVPPFPVLPAAPGRNRRCWSDRCAASDG